MADINQVTQEFLDQLNRLAAQMSRAGSAADALGGNAKASAQNVGQGFARLRGDLDRGRMSYNDAVKTLRHLDDQFENLDKSVKDHAAGTRIATERQKIAAELIYQGVGNTVAKLARVGLEGAFTYYKNQTITAAKSLQDNVGGMQMAFSLQNKALEDQSKILSGFGDTAEAAAVSLAMIPGGQGLAGVFAAGAIAFKGLSSLVEGSAEGFKILQTEISKTDTAFRVVAGAGALFADGMSGVREQAAQAGLDLKDFSELTARNSETFTRLGGSVADGVKRFTLVNSKMADFRQDLINLGYSTEDQAQATAEYMDMLSKTGQLRAGQEEQIAKGAKEYLINLKAISSLTGEDVKRTQARVKEANEQAAVQAALAEGGVEMKAKFDNLIARFPGYEKEIGQLLTIGEVVDPVRAQMLAGNEELNRALRQGVENTKNTSVSITEAANENERAIKEHGASIVAAAREQQKTYGIVQMANGGLAEQAELANRNLRLGEQGREQAEQAAKGGKTARENAEAAAKTADQLTQAVSGAQVAFRDAATALNRDVTPMIKKFAVEGFGQLKGMKATVEEGDKKVRETLNAITGMTNILERGRLSRIPQPEQRLPPEGTSVIIPGGGHTDDVGAGTMGALDPRQTRRLRHNETQLASATNLSKPEATPVSLSLASLSDSTSNQFRDSFVQAMVAYQQQKRNTANTPKEPAADNSADVAIALREAFAGPNGLSQTINGLKGSIETDSKQQYAALEKQNEKLENLLALMRDNVDYSRRIANEMA